MGIDMRVPADAEQIIEKLIDELPKPEERKKKK